MRVIEILTEMAFPKKVAEAKVRAKEETINLHVVKLLSFAADETVNTYWRKEILAETQLLASYNIRVGNGVRRISASEYYKMLYAEPFEQNEQAYTQALIKIAATKAEQAGTPLLPNARAIEEIASNIHTFHVDLSIKLHAGDDCKILIDNLG